MLGTMVRLNFAQYISLKNELYALIRINQSCSNKLLVFSSMHLCILRIKNLRKAYKHIYLSLFVCLFE